MTFYYELYISNSSEDKSETMILITIEKEYNNCERNILLFFIIFLLKLVTSVFISIFRSEVYSKSVYVSVFAVIVILKCLVLSNYLAAAAVSNFSSCLIYFLYLVKF